MIKQDDLRIAVKAVEVAVECIERIGLDKPRKEELQDLHFALKDTEYAAYLLRKWQDEE